MKRTIIYAAIAAILVLTFILQESLDSGKNTIKISSLPGDLEKIVLEGGGKHLELYADAAKPADTKDKEAGKSSEEQDFSKWKVGEEAFPVDAKKIANLVSAVGSIGRADVISSREGYKKFGLDEKNERILRFFSKGEEVLVLHLGSKASSGASVYGRIQDQKEVVMLPQDLSGKFSVYSEDFREKQMAAFPGDSIDRMEITSPGQEKLLLSKKAVETWTAKASTAEASTAKTAATDGSGDGESGSSTDSGKAGDSAPAGGENKAENVWTAKTAGGEKIEAADEGSFRNLLTELADLRAEGFPESDPEGEPFADLIVYRNGGERAVVSLWPPDGDDNYPVRVSTNRYSFTVPKWRARRLLLGLDRYFEAFEKEK